MSHKFNSAVAVIGIDIGKNSFHVVGHDRRGAIVVRQKWSRGQVEARLAFALPPKADPNALRRSVREGRSAGVGLTSISPAYRMSPRMAGAILDPARAHDPGFEMSPSPTRPPFAASLCSQPTSATRAVFNPQKTLPAG